MKGRDGVYSTKIRNKMWMYAIHVSHASQSMVARARATCRDIYSFTSTLLMGLTSYIYMCKSIKSIVHPIHITEHYELI